MRGVHEQFVGIDVDDAETLQAGRLSRMLLDANGALGFPEVLLDPYACSGSWLALPHAGQVRLPAHLAELGKGRAGLGSVARRR